MATSYISEHSAEFYLVPYLKKELEKHFKFVAPIFPWINRETSKVSRLLHGDDHFRLLIMFPRRPKLDKSDNKRIFVTINWELQSFKEFAEEYGVPVIAGCPIASSFWELSRSSNYVWMEISNQQLEKYLNPVQDTGCNKTCSSNMSINNIVELVNTSSTMDMDRFVEFLRELRYAQPVRFLFGPRYKPVYFLIKEH
ncbi:MAG: hypothetical protein KAU38_06260 [Desulfobacterales bacterium]|nr:hypothetical protein [Desulfobacterales bacterium]